MQLFENDVKFLCKSTGLKKERLLDLVEDENDFYLVLDSVAKLKHKKEDLFNLSFETFSKMIILIYAAELNYPIEEKMYVADCICKNFPRIRKKINFGYLKTADTSEKLSRYYLILMGILYKKLKKNFFTVNIWNRVKEGFSLKGPKDFVCHLEIWIKLLHKIEKDNWFFTKDDREQKVCPPKDLEISI